MGKRAGMDRWHLIHKRVKPNGRRDVILPIHPQFLDDIFAGRKKADYRPYALPDIKRIWFTPIGSNGRITAVARVIPTPKSVNGRYEYVYQYLYRVKENIFMQYPCKAL
jgi:hypothetical protein